MQSRCARCEAQTAYKTASCDASQERDALGVYIDRIERLHGEKFGKQAFAPGRTPGLAFMAHLWEPLPFLWKPLAVHVAAEGMRGATCAALRLLGFRAARCQARTGLQRNPDHAMWELYVTCGSNSWECGGERMFRLRHMAPAPSYGLGAATCGQVLGFWVADTPQAEDSPVTTLCMLDVLIYARSQGQASDVIDHKRDHAACR